MIKIFNIERFATHDGDGIRTVVFMQGCPLSCPWCSNPESQSLLPQLLYTIKNCMGCRICEKECSTGAISFQKGKFSYNPDKCRYCHRCEDVCPAEALEFSGKEMETGDIVAEVLKDMDYYQGSGGGVTVSGGEPFVQFKGLMELLVMLRENGIHTAVETTGQYPLEYLKMAFPLIDVVLFDIKHLDSGKLKDRINGNLEQILSNFRYIAQKSPEKLVVRVPVIPGFNDQETVLEAIITLAGSHQVRKVDLLPYHTLGKHKYDKMAKIYQMQGVPMPDKNSLEKYRNFGKLCDVEVRIGG